MMMQTAEIKTEETGRKYRCQDIVKALEAHIVGSQLAAGVELPGTAELASRYRVSEKTVHRALQHLADLKLIRRVRGSGSFVRGNMGLPPHSRIGFFYFESLNHEIPSLNSILCRNSRSLLRQVLEDAGLSVEFHSEQLPKVENCPLLEMELSRFDYIIAEAGYRQVAADALRNFPGEVILFGDDEFVFGPWHQVFFDYRPGFRRALEFLMERGFRKAMAVGVPNLSTAEHRYEALCDAAELCGFGRENLCFPVPSGDYFHFQILCGREYGKMFLKEFKCDTAIISLSDYVTVGVLDVLYEHGPKPGREVQLISYDNLLSQVPEFKERFICNAVTHPLSSEFRAIVKLMSEIHLAPNPDFYRSIVVPAREFVVRTDGPRLR